MHTEEKNLITSWQDAAYIGPNKIAEVELLDEKTPAGSGIFKVTYLSGEVEVMPQVTFDHVRTEEASDYSTVAQVRIKKNVDDIIAKVLMENDVRVLEINAILQAVATQIDNHFNRATNFLWTGSDRGYVAGMNPMNDRTLVETELINAKIPAPTEVATPSIPLEALETNSADEAGDAGN